MEQDLRLQRILEEVKLVVGMGNRNKGELCIMSLVALLAGERHTDSPKSTSPLIRQFVISLNDQMPCEVRQRLKPFAPNLLGTNDGLDRERSEVLRRVLAEEILPRALGQHQESPDPAGTRRCTEPLRRLWIRLWLRRSRAHCHIARLIDQVRKGDHWPSSDAGRARATARLISLCAREAADAGEKEWYWRAAIGLLDRLCEVGAEARCAAAASALPPDRLAWLEKILEGRRPAMDAPQAPLASSGPPSRSLLQCAGTMAIGLPN